MTTRYLAIASFLLGLALALPGAWIHAKAVLAQVLIERAWQGGRAGPPWPWADTYPVLRLRVPRLAVDQYVLSGGRGNALAFGPTQLGRATGDTALVLAGHRDTHFAFLRQLQSGDALQLRAQGGQWQTWRVAETQVVDSRKQPLALADGGLYLVTCYPFDAIDSGGPLRYLVSAVPEKPDIL